MKLYNRKFLATSSNQIVRVRAVDDGSRIPDKPTQEPLAMTNRQQTREHLESSLSALVDSMVSNLEHKDVRILREFIDNREYGVALEWLHAVIKECSILISTEQGEEIQRIAKVMEINIIP